MDCSDLSQGGFREFVLPILCRAVAEVHAATEGFDDVDAAEIGDLERSTNNNIEQQGIDYVQNTLTHEIADGIFRFSTCVPDAAPGGFTFNQFLIRPISRSCSTRARGGCSRS